MLERWNETERLGVVLDLCLATFVDDARYVQYLGSFWHGADVGCTHVRHVVTWDQQPERAIVEPVVDADDSNAYYVTRLRLHVPLPTLKENHQSFDVAFQDRSVLAS